MANEVLLGSARHTQLLRQARGALSDGATKNTMVRAMGHQRVAGNFRTDQPPASGYPRVRQSLDGSNWSLERVIDRDQNKADFQYPFDITLKYPYVSVEYTQGGTAATAFECFVELIPVFGSGTDVVPGQSGTTKLASAKDTHFTAASAVNNHLTANLTGLPANVGTITGIALLAAQNLDWELFFWTTDGFDDADMDSDSGIESQFFAAGEAVNLANATASTYRYYRSGLVIPYQDADQTQELHVSIAPRNGAKLAGAAGELVVVVFFKPES